MRIRCPFCKKITKLTCDQAPDGYVYDFDESCGPTDGHDLVGCYACERTFTFQNNYVVKAVTR